MQLGHLDDLAALVAVGRERSFTKAAAKLGVSQSALSQTIRQLEARLGVRLLTRKLLRDYPDIKIEIITDYGLTDIVTERYDAGVRSGEQVAKDMIAVRIGPDMRMAVVGAPSYFKTRPEPKKPQDLMGHNCINLRLPMHGNVYAWEFEKGNRELRVRVDGQFTFNATTQLLNAALSGCGLAYVPEGMVQTDIDKGRLKRVLADWCQPYSGYHLFYPSRRQTSAAFALVVDALRYRR
jgi:DNA-binding transcriptional LysR family regulator